MIKILKKNHNTILIFIIPLILILIGFAVYRDYGISSDEEITRNNSLVSIKYIFDVLFPQYTDNFELLKNVPNLRDYDLTDAYKFPGLASSAYGVFFDVLVVAFIEILLEVKNFSDVFYYRHLTNHYLFVISVICFYFLCISVFKNKLYSFFGAAILYTSPRIFAESFYNNKDVAFLSFFIFLIFFSIKFLKKPNYYNAFLLSIFAAMATNTRIIGIYVGILVALFFIIEFLMKNKFDPKKANTLVFFLFFNLIFLYLFWPFLWENPISNLIHAIKYAANVPTGLNVFYLGDFYGVKYLPWHYLVVCFFVTTPILILILIAGGLVNLTLRFSRRLINIDKNDSYKDIWRGEKEKIFLFLLLVIFVPILSIFLFNSIVYNSWRHIFFLYPPLILVSIYFLDIIVIKFRLKKISSYINIILLVAVLSNIYNLITLHPFQGIYFNSIFEKNANKLFEIDYWGISNKHSLEELTKKNIGKNKITVGVAQGIKKTSPDAFVICITNPLDVIVMALQKYSGFPTNKVIGMAGILDSSRFKYFLSQEMKVPVKNIKTLVLGGHGDSMVPMPSNTTVDGKSLKQLLTENKITKEKLGAIIDRTRKGGGEINKLLEKGSAFYAPAASGVEMAESYIKNLKKTLPCAAYLNGQYGVKNLYVGVPVVIGDCGVEKIVEIKLEDKEKENFEISIKEVKKLFETATKIDPELKN